MKPKKVNKGTLTKALSKLEDKPATPPTAAAGWKRGYDAALKDVGEEMGVTNGG